MVMVWPAASMSFAVLLRAQHDEQQLDGYQRE